MKKMIPGLVLCLGLSQFAIAADTIAPSKLTEKETKGAIAWLKAHPQTAIAAAVVFSEALGLVGCMIYDGVKSTEVGFFNKVKGGIVNGTYKLGRAHKLAAWDYTTKYAWDGSKKVVNIYLNNKRYSIPATVLVVLLAAVVADYATTDADTQMRIVQAWNKLFGKDAEQPVATPAA